MVISLIRIRTPMRFADALDLQHIHGAELESNSEPLAKLILLQHAPVYTLGRRTQKQHLPCSEHDLAVRTGADVTRADRGGSVTYHAPGQLTAYMLLNLQECALSVHQHLYNLEEAAIATLAHFGIAGRREPELTGVWVGDAPEKICAIGISARRWVTYHGLSLNVDLDLQPFSEIVPCGLEGKSVTSMAKVLNRSVNISEVENAMSRAFASVYGAAIEIGMV